MTNAERISDFLKQAGTFYFLSSDGDRAKGRPFSFSSMRNGRLVLSTGTQKKVYAQVLANPKVEIVATVGNRFLRYDGEVEFFDDPEFTEKTMEENPFMGKLYNEETGLNIQFFHLKNGHAEIINAMTIEEEFDVE